MKCDTCENEATVHEVRIAGGKKVETHLCEQCAASHGVGPPGQTGTNPLAQLLSPYGVQTPARVACDRCGLSFAEFRRVGVLGCPDCYRVFEEQLIPLIARAHEGGCQHTGKVPERLQVPGPGNASQLLARIEEVRQRMRALEQRLNEAIAGEHYEIAARLRDELEQLAKSSPPEPGTTTEAGGDEDGRAFDSGGSDG